MRDQPVMENVMTKWKLRAVAVLALAVFAPVAAAASPACQACRISCEFAYPGNEEAFLNCFANCYDENGFACQRDAG
jgi:hypothetical protein